ncbi:hypothetical protein PV433_09360 [Paenibacillus sp. GYB004]|uniref:hypothetical protein n=1 Tax=Paenibacillus sp. GYB004 TaxID=2994393 RepID=UPI002F96762F
MNELSITVLKIYSSRTNLSLSQLSAIVNGDWFSLAEHVGYLRKKGYIRINSDHALLKGLSDSSLIDPDTPLEITIEGKTFLESERKLSKTKRNELIRYAITTAIAVAAFTKSFFF